MDPNDELPEKIKKGAVVVLFLSNESLLGGYLDYLDAGAAIRVKRDFEIPLNYTEERFAQFPLDRTLFVWLETPRQDTRRGCDSDGVAQA
jgi:hypothetical protein